MKAGRIHKEICVIVFRTDLSCVNIGYIRNQLECIEGDPQRHRHPYYFHICVKELIQTSPEKPRIFKNTENKKKNGNRENQIYLLPLGKPLILHDTDPHDPPDRSHYQKKE